MKCQPIGRPQVRPSSEIHWKFRSSGRYSDCVIEVYEAPTLLPNRTYRKVVVRDRLGYRAHCSIA